MGRFFWLLNLNFGSYILTNFQFCGTMILVIARAIVLRDSCALIFATMIRKWGYQMKMSKPCLFVAGVVFFALVLVATDAFLPLWLGVENGVIENLQVVILAVAMYVCKRKMTAGGDNTACFGLRGS